MGRGIGDSDQRDLIGRLEPGDIQHIRSFLPGPQGKAHYFLVMEREGRADTRYGVLNPTDRGRKSARFLDTTPREFCDIVERLIGECGLIRDEVVRMHQEWIDALSRAGLHDGQTNRERDESRGAREESGRLGNELFEYVMPVADGLLKEGFWLEDFTQIPGDTIRAR